MTGIPAPTWFTATISNAIISQTKDFFWFFIAFLNVHENSEYPSLNSEMIDLEH